MNTRHKTANAIGGKTARACESCLLKRARWFCAADDAFLCQACDASVHSANQVARRHERVRLEGSSTGSVMSLGGSAPAWHQGFTRRARTPRAHRKSSRVRPSKEGENVMNANAPRLVPEIGGEEGSPVENDEQVLFRVPVLDPFESGICNLSDEMDTIFTSERSNNHSMDELDDFSGFLPSDMDLAELAADVENLLGNGIEEELGFPDCRKESFTKDICFEDKRVKLEEDEELDDVLAPQMDPNFINSSITAKEEEKEKIVPVMQVEAMNEEDSEAKVKRKIFLKLNYEEVITAWGSQGLPWTTGSRPQFNPDDRWPEFTGNGSVAVHLQNYGAVGGGLGDAGATGSGRCCGSDSGREARVSRYREKRRTRLFSKKIRYEVRRLNAEKRPRVKGRFVKRTSLFANPAPATAAAASYNFFSR